ncbi:hypothetical protein Ga0123462_1340 [Mariprofundus ferrinatatus]|uniref:Uncharacterized protein n=1 Tax=Mariprofundus ferrinatatus TaxID=1921087 RepID=A0A2K8L4P1_9PROT|nr:DUF6765 family protein [Mariprofundus ferrinatatus]ATX82203.1 hypothetical protein Ga0123462_1340 [Mariprofundus ferrinatatus]
MDTEFHYYITGFLARCSGFSDSEATTIATASEYVDYNCTECTVYQKRSAKPYRNQISQTMDITKPRSERIRIYPLFHFIPGDPNADSARRIDNRIHQLNTTPDNEIANRIIDHALGGNMVESEDQLLHAIGIASHAYIDTWAHQNFIGIEDSFNHAGSILPNIGHADVEHKPDIPCLIWQDERLLDPLIDNRKRFIDAGMALYRKYLSFNEGRNIRSGYSPERMEDELAAMLGPSSKASSMEMNRYQRYRKYRIELYYLGQFDPDGWFDAAVHRKAGSYFWRSPSNMKSTEWYRFQEAVKRHAEFAFELIKPRFEAEGINV